MEMASHLDELFIQMSFPIQLGNGALAMADGPSHEEELQCIWLKDNILAPTTKVHNQNLAHRAPTTSKQNI